MSNNLKGRLPGSRVGKPTPDLQVALLQQAQSQQQQLPQQQQQQLV
jgi:5-hydroxyisourate hydrolase-like protein (transthyretin family)